MLGFKTIQKIRVIKRFNHILFAFLKFGLGGLIYEAGLRKHIPFLRRMRYSQRKQKDQQELALRLRQTLERLGPVFVKFGQILSTRSDFLNKDYIAELEQLQSRVPPFPYHDAQRIVEECFD